MCVCGSVPGGSGLGAARAVHVLHELYPSRAGVRLVKIASGGMLVVGLVGVLVVVEGGVVGGGGIRVNVTVGVTEVTSASTTIRVVVNGN